MDAVTNELRVEEAKKQENLFPGKISAETAVSLALKSFLTDSSHIESPLALATLVALEDPDLSSDPAEKILFSHFNRPETVIRFVVCGEEAEHGETVEKNWIIRLKIPTLSDHIFWAVVDRSGVTPPYNYGFN
ncbi:hypothetical protein EBT16_11160 [bacterium]|nr:hypothetical protein [bacterium]